MRRARVVVSILLLTMAQGALPAVAQTAAGSPRAQTPAPAATPAPTPSTANPFMGGVPSGQLSAQPIAISIADAINRALDHNLGILTATEAAGHASGARWVALSQLLPNVNGRLSETRQVINLAAFGFGASGPALPGFPLIVGPFNVFDVRGFVSQSVLDLAQINNVRAETHNVAAAKYSVKTARDLVVLVAANLYLQSLAASARAEAAQAQLETAQALYTQAVDLKNGGLVPGIDVLRAQVELSNEQQRSTATANAFEIAKLQLARVMGLPTGQAFTLSDQIPYAPVPEMTVEQALERAYQSRPDYQGALERVKAAQASRAAIVGEALPSVRVNADLGYIGLTPSSAERTYTVVGEVNVPIFQGGRLRGRLLEADADLRDRQAEAEDLKAGIYYDVRTAFLDLTASGEQLQVATRGRELANQQLTQSRDRFAAGVASNIEVVQAQQAVAIANEQYIGGLYSYNVSKAALARALGVAEEAARQYLGGSR